MSRHAGVSPRTFARRFRRRPDDAAAVAALPAGRSRRARLLEESDLPVETIAWRAGFGTAASLRDHFRRATATSALCLPALVPPRLSLRRLGSASRVSRRDQIKLSEDEVRQLLGESGSRSSPASGRAGGRTRCRSGLCPRDGVVWIWTYAKSQKVRNLERDPRATVLVETGHEYGELRGAMIESEAVIHRDFETVLGFAEELTVRYAEGISAVEGDAKAALEAQAPKRVAISFPPLRMATWDHRKLGGTY